MKLSNYTQAAVDIAKKAGDYILTREKGQFKVEEKVSSYDFVTDVDTSTESMIRSYLIEAFPTHAFAGEESGMDEDKLKYNLTHMAKDEFCWVVDPLDGTINFIHGLGGYAVSIALMKGSEIISSAIYLPTCGEMYCAEKGSGVWCNGNAISVSSCKHMKDALISYSIPTIDMDYRQEVVEYFEPLSTNSFNLRILGSAAASIAYIACGKLDAYVELGHHPWDIAAGVLMVEEAGGKLSNHKGETFTVADPRLVASNGICHDEVVKTLTHNTI